MAKNQYQQKQNPHATLGENLANAGRAALIADLVSGYVNGGKSSPGACHYILSKLLGITPDWIMSFELAMKAGTLLPSCPDYNTDTLFRLYLRGYVPSITQSPTLVVLSKLLGIDTGWLTLFEGVYMGRLSGAMLVGAEDEPSVQLGWFLVNRDFGVEKHPLYRDYRPIHPKEKAEIEARIGGT